MARVTKERIVAQRIMEETPYAENSYYLDVETLKVTDGVKFTFESKKYNKIELKARFTEDFKSTEFLKVLKTDSTDIYCIIYIEPLEKLGVKYNKTTVRYYDYNHTAEEPEYKDYVVELLPDMYHIFEIKGDSLVIDHAAVALDKSYPFTDANTIYYFTNVSAGTGYSDFIWLTDDEKIRKYNPKSKIKHKETKYDNGAIEIEEAYLGICYMFIDTDKTKTIVDIATGTKDSAVPHVISYKKYMFGDRKEDKSTTPSTYTASYRALMEKI